MPKKILKTDTGALIEVKSILLQNGNLLVPTRNRETNRAEWAEVSPGDPDFKRWLPLAEEEPDPR